MRSIYDTVRKFLFARDSWLSEDKGCVGQMLISPSPNLFVEIITPKVMVSEGRGFLKALSHESRILVNRNNPLKRIPQRALWL